MVDDDPNIVEIVSETLRDAGFDVLTAADGVAATQLMQHNPDIDVLFSDVVMPGGMSGIDLARQALSTRPNLSVLLASGYSEGWLKDIPDNCEFIAKPYRAAQILQVLRNLAAQRMTPD
ncbi:MAG TPA: response regulator [Lysobacter sp.]|nr:response regulator [Lysobacter sp.]